MFVLRFIGSPSTTKRSERFWKALFTWTLGALSSIYTHLFVSYFLTINMTMFQTHWNTALLWTQPNSTTVSNNFLPSHFIDNFMVSAGSFHRLQNTWASSIFDRVTPPTMYSIVNNVFNSGEVNQELIPIKMRAMNLMVN